MAENRSGKVQTVLGCIDPNSLGITHTHEHLSMTFKVSYHPAMPRDKGNEELPFTMGNLGWIRQYPYSHKPNLFLNDEHSAVLDEIKMFKQNGGGSIVDNTTIGIDRDVEFLKEVSKKSGVKIIAGAGYYVGGAHPSDMDSKTQEALANQMITEVDKGCDGTTIKCGVIGEIGCSWPLLANETKVLQATAQAQTALGCPVIIHPGRHPTAPTEIVRILAEAGGDIRKTVMSHLDRTIFDQETLANFAAEGSYLEYDLFGIEGALYQPNTKVYMPNDGQRIEFIQFLIKEGYADRILMAHDIHTKHRLVKYGGHGFSHILLNVLPMMLEAGVSQETINQILIDNPREWLTFK